MPPMSLPTPEQMQRWMQTYHVTTRMLSDAIYITQGHTRRIVIGKRPIMPDTAARLIAYFAERRAQLKQNAVTIDQLDLAA